VIEKPTTTAATQSCLKYNKNQETDDQLSTLPLEMRVTVEGFGLTVCFLSVSLKCRSNGE